MAHRQHSLHLPPGSATPMTISFDSPFSHQDGERSAVAEGVSHDIPQPVNVGRYAAQGAKLLSAVSWVSVILW